MANKDGHRRFGSVRKLPSGRYQARYLGPDGKERSAPETFERKTDAARYLGMVEVQMARREWTDPERGKVLLQVYAEQWIRERPKLRPRTVHLYTWLLGKHVVPYLGTVPLARLDTAMVREWRARLIESGVSETMAAKAYRLLRAVLMTAVREDGILHVNPCRIPGADQEKTPERPTLTIPLVFQLADVMPRARYRALILLSTFACLRWGEAVALRRGDIDLTARTVRIERQYNEVRGQGLIIGPPKSRAGLRTVSIPKVIIPIIKQHLKEFVGPEDAALVFTGPSGLPIWRGNFNQLVKWREAVTAIGYPKLHFHDLRHTGNTLASKTGASLADLMARMGHDNPRAALIYQHASAEADQSIADAVSAKVVTDRRKAKDAAKKASKPARPRPSKKRPDDPDDGAGSLAKVG
jgi:integrase